jgi:ssDNA-binding Zn-finger/Zn-ribbon topoisomerase 1
MILSKIEAERLVSSRETNKAHIMHVKEIIEDKRNGNYCPKCGSAMLERESKNGSNRGQKFLDCSRYPKCRGTAPMSVENELEMVVDDVDEFDSGFTDSWGNRTWRDDEQPWLTDRAFR